MDDDIDIEWHGNRVRINLDPLEWLLVLIILGIIAWAIQK
jgi:hypothetical protein